MLSSKSLKTLEAAKRTFVKQPTPSACEHSRLSPFRKFTGERHVPRTSLPRDTPSNEKWGEMTVFAPQATSF